VVAGDSRTESKTPDRQGREWIVNNSPNAPQALLNPAPLSPWWRQAAILVMAFGFTLLTVVTVKTYKGAPPIPERVLSSSGQLLFTAADIHGGQDVFFKYGLMEHGTLWGHGAYLGPDYTAEYLHRQSEIARDTEAKDRYGKPLADLTEEQTSFVGESVKRSFKQNRYDEKTQTLIFTPGEEASFLVQQREWRDYFAGKTPAPGLPSGFIHDGSELRSLNAYFAWATWATVALRPGTQDSYTNNWPYEPLAGNTPTSSTYLWSALSLVCLFGGLGLVLFVFGRFDYLGWGGASGHVHVSEGPLHRWKVTASQNVLGLYFAVRRAPSPLEGHGEPECARIVLRGRCRLVPPASGDGRRACPLSRGAWRLLWLRPGQVPALQPGPHLAPAIGHLLDRHVLGCRRPVLGTAGWRRRAEGTAAWRAHPSGRPGRGRVRQSDRRGFGDQQQARNAVVLVGPPGQRVSGPGALLAAAPGRWAGVLAVSDVPRSTTRHEIRRKGRTAFALSVRGRGHSLFYLPALFYGSHTNFAIIDNWRFWIIHLWVEGFFELFATVLVAVMFVQMGLVRTKTATRLVYLDAILYLAGGIVGTGHHWYFTGQGTLNMGLAACFSALEVVPLTLLTLDAWDFIRLQEDQNARGLRPPWPPTRSGPSISSSPWASGTSWGRGSSVS
jgi:nitric oxide reductase subunit B